MGKGLLYFAFFVILLSVLIFGIYKYVSYYTLASYTAHARESLYGKGNVQKITIYMIIDAIFLLSVSLLTLFALLFGIRKSETSTLTKWLFIFPVLVLIIIYTSAWKYVTNFRFGSPYPMYLSWFLEFVIVVFLILVIFNFVKGRKSL